ncbi:YcgN family cysteine cluster protein [Falsiroseomonas sp. CW058]|uniref:YcgN family cysteine cluster protein n=1 Tax=Falsiroseomonas sp. CW058 TaxID=3388664 RepID=UPI003D31CDDA
MATTEPFWTRKTLGEMTRAEWESLCDGCGRCCLHKLRDEATEELGWTNVACRLLDTHSCRCSDYANRRARVPDCVKLTPAKVAAIDWLPPTCAYRLLAEGQGLPWWHPLVSGTAETVHEAGISVRGKAVAEREAGALEDHLVTWPGRIPRAARPQKPTGRTTTP